MKKIISGIISITTFLLLLGLCGGLEQRTMTETQFIISALVLFAVLYASIWINGR